MIINTEAQPSQFFTRISKKHQKVATIPLTAGMNNSQHLQIMPINNKKSAMARLQTIQTNPKRRNLLTEQNGLQ